MKYKLYIILTLVVISAALSACKKSITNDVPESRKELQGAWQIIKITQNGDDLSTLLDLSKYRITFNGDKYTTTANELPFLARKNGQWGFNDPNYPFAITFTAEGGTPVSTAISYPIVGQQRQMELSFDLGCNRNVYTYTLKPVN